MNDDYDKVIEFFDEHEIAIYGFGPTDYGAEEGTLLWCIKELNSMFDINAYIDNRDRIIKQRTLKVICALIDIYEKEDTEEKDFDIDKAWELLHGEIDKQSEIIDKNDYETQSYHAGIKAGLSIASTILRLCIKKGVNDNATD